MIFVNEIPHLKLHKMRTYLPRDKNNPYLNSIMFVCNNDYKSTEELMKNKMFFNDNKYHLYYLEFLYRRKLFNKMMNINIRKERKVIYEEIENNNSQIKGAMHTSRLKNRNVYFDMYKYNNYFFNISEKKTFKLKINSYIEYLNWILNREDLKSYTNRVVFIEIESWIDEPFKNIKRLSYDNPIMIFYFLLKRNVEKFKELGDIDFIMYNKQGEKIRVNPSLCNDKSFLLFKTELSKLSKNLSGISDDEKDDIDNSEVIKKNELYNNILSNVYDIFRFTGKETYDNGITIDDENQVNEIENPDISEELDSVIKQTVHEEVDKLDVKEISPEKANDIYNKVINNKALLTNLYKESQESKTGKSSVSLKRDAILRDKQKDIRLENIKLEDILNMKDTEGLLQENDIGSKISSSNVNMSKVSYPSFEKVYNEKYLKKDIMNSFTFLNDKSIPVFIRDVKIEDSSDEINYKETYTIDLEDGNRVRHKIKVDVPKFIDDKFMFLGGNKKIIVKQLFLKPIVKTRPDTVQICTNYNKVFVFRHGDKVSSKVERLKKAINIPEVGISFERGNNSSINLNYLTTIEYDEFAKDYSWIKIKNHEFIFNQTVVEARLKKMGIKVTDPEFCIGFHKTNGKDHPLIMSAETQKLGPDMDIVDTMLSLKEGKLINEFDQAVAGKKFMYTRAKIMDKFVPMILLLGFCEGLTTILRKCEVKYYFTDKRPSVNLNEHSVQFGDGHLVYEINNMHDALLLNGLSFLPTKAYNYSDFDSRDVYLDIFDILYNSKIIANAFKNSYDFLIDPISKEVLESLNQPTDYVGVMLYANKLLADNAFMRENNMNLYRIRSNEIVTAYLYKALSRSYLEYELTSHNPNPVKISIQRDKILKDLLMSTNVEDYSILNPVNIGA